MIINHNMKAINAHRMMGINASGMGKSIEKLSSGLRINRAADDAAGLYISEKMRSQVRGLKQASRNSQDGISAVQTAEGALDEVHSMLQRMRELAVQGANDTNQKEDRDAIQAEIDQLTDEIQSISEKTQFNKEVLLNGDFTNKNLQVGANQDQNLKISIESMSAKGLGVGHLKDGSDKDIKAPVDTDAADAKKPVSTDLTGRAVYTTKEDYENVDTGNSKFKISVDDKETDVIDLDTTSGATIDKAIETINKELEKAKIEFKAEKDGSKIKFVANNPGEVTDFKITGQTGTNKAKGIKVDASAEAGELKTGGFDTDKAVFELESEYEAATSSDNSKFTISVGDKKTEEITLTDTNGGTAAAAAAAINEKLEAAGIEFKAEANGNKIRFVANNPGKVKAEDFKITGASSGNNVAKGIKVGDGADAAIETINSGKEPKESDPNLKTISDIDVSSYETANTAIGKIDLAIKTVSEQRSKLGAIQNRLEHTIRNLDNAAENTQAAESRIRDVDMADEMSKFTKSNILTQASQAMLAQANQLPQQVLQLLR